jgi:heat shock protein HtpX
MFMNKSKWLRLRIVNEIKSFTLILVLAAITGVIAYVIAGAFLAFIVFAGIGFIYLISPGIAPKLMMGFFKVRPLMYNDAPQIHRMMSFLSRRAELENSPEIYFIPTETMAAFATGTREKSAVALSVGVLTKLNFDEIAAIAAHEVSHIRNNDMRSMWFALLLGRLTEMLSLWGQVLLLLSLPFIFMNQIQVAFVPIAVLIFAPLFSYMVQLTLSRVNEFNADLGSSELMGSPQPLISALSKIEYERKGFFGYLFPRKTFVDESSLFRTHPPTEERIRRLREIQAENPAVFRRYGHRLASY